MNLINRPREKTLLATAALGMLLLLLSISSFARAQPAERFLLSTDPPSIMIKAGTSAVSTVTVTSPTHNGFAGSVALTAAISPEGPTLALDPANVTLVSGRTATSNLTISTTVHTPLGNYTVTVTGTGGELQPRTATIRVTVTTASDFTIDTSPSILVTQLGRTVHGNVTVEATNFDGSISLAASSGPNGPVAILTPDTLPLQGNTTATSGLSITAPCDSIPGDYSIVVTGRWGPLVRSASPLLTIADLSDPADCPPDFRLTVDRLDLTITVGQIGTFFISLGGINNFSGNVTLGITVYPPGPRVQLVSSTVELQPKTVASAQVLIQTTTAFPGTYSVNVTGVSGELVHSVVLTATLVAATANPPPQTSPPPGGDNGANFALPFTILVAAVGAIAAATVWAAISMLRSVEKERNRGLGRPSGSFDVGNS